jgi:hypothetical protein
MGYVETWGRFSINTVKTICYKTFIERGEVVRTVNDGMVEKDVTSCELRVNPLRIACLPQAGNSRLTANIRAEDQGKRRKRIGPRQK